MNVSPLINSLEKTLTANGCVTNSSSGSSLVDLFFQIAAMRAHKEQDIINAFVPALKEDPESAIKIMFWARDIRGGQGERRVFNVLIKHLAHTQTDLIEKNISLIPKYGRWDDVLSLLDTPAEASALSLISNALSQGDSLCAKWMPREKSSKRVSARKIRQSLGLSPRNYRKLLSSHTSVVENKMCMNEWESIDYGSVPSVAMNTYKGAFERHSPDKWIDYLSDLESGEKKVNSSTLYPHQIVKGLLDGFVHSPITDNEKRIANSQWSALPNWLLSNPHRLLPVVDTSGSMYGSRCSSLLPIYVSLALGIYIAERNNGPFKDHFITFSETPTLQKVYGGTIYDKVNNLKSADWGMSTDIEAVFDRILESAVRDSIAEEDMPNSVIILSDMEFNQCAKNYSLTAMESFRESYAKHGYELPNIIFWNLNARAGNVPVSFDEAGSALVSGFSPSLLVSILSDGEISPVKIMRNTIDSERYKEIKA